MIRIGDVVNARGRLSKVVEIDGSDAVCVHISGNGNIEIRRSAVADLRPLWLALSPRSMWPDVNDAGEPATQSRTPRRKSRKSNRARAH